MKHLLLIMLSLLSSFSSAQIVTSIKPLTLITQAVTQGIEQPVQLLPTGMFGTPLCTQTLTTPYAATS